MPKLKYTFADYMANPAGRGSAVKNVTHADTYEYEKELMSLESRNGKSSYTVYRVTKNAGTQVYYIHFLIPSSTKGFFNDVVLEFTQNESDQSSIRNINHYSIRFFSNDTNFVYTYAYTFKSHGLMIPELEKKIPLRCLMQKPTMRNPDNAMGHNKAICYSYVIMDKHNLFNKDELNRIAVSGGLSKLVSSIPSFDQKVKERNEITKEEKEKGKKEESNNVKVVKSKGLLGNSLPAKPKFTSVIGNVKKTSTVKKIKKR